MPIYKGDNDFAMVYENLVRAVFKCGRLEDPWDFAEASVYDANFVPDPNETAKEILYTVIACAITDNKGNQDLIDGLIELRDRTRELETQEEGMEIINEMIDLLNENGY